MYPATEIEFDLPSSNVPSLNQVVEGYGVSGPDAALPILIANLQRDIQSNTMISYILLVSRQGKYF